MRFLRFLGRELVLHGILFAVVGTVVLSALYLLSIGAPPNAYVDAAKSFWLLISGSKDYSMMHPGFSSSQIIASGAAVTLPLALISLIFLIIIALICSANAVTGRYLEINHGEKKLEILHKIISIITSFFAAVPLFVGFWFLYAVIGDGISIPLIALLTVLLAGLFYLALAILFMILFEC